MSLEVIRQQLHLPYNEREVVIPSFSNLNYRIGPCVIRIPSTEANRFVSRHHEKQHLDIAFTHGFSPLIVRYFDESTGVMATTFLNNHHSCSETDFTNPSIQRNAVLFLKRLHTSSCPFQLRFNPFGRLETTQSLITLNDTEEVVQYYQQLRTLYMQIPQALFEWVPCHNDPSPQNFMEQAGELSMVDWETSAINDPMWDLAHFSAILKLSESEIDALLDTYQPKHHDLAKAKLIYFLPFIHLASALHMRYMMISENFKTPLLDLTRIYHERCTLTRACMTSGSFTQAIIFLRGHHDSNCS